MGTVVGPPYAITGLSPQIGPITGGQLLTVTGIDFVDTSAVVVRFVTRKGYIDMNGEYKSPTEITVVTPDFEKYGANEVDVRISLKGDSFTTTFQKYRFFLITDAKRCAAFGPGLLSGCKAGVKAEFIIAAKDTSGKARESGDDTFKVTIRKTSGEPVEAAVEDAGNGTYKVTYTAPSAGDYTISTSFESKTLGGAIPGGAVTVSCVADGA